MRRARAWPSLLASPETRQLFAEHLRQSSTRPKRKRPNPPAPLECHCPTDQPRNGIVRLPTYLVRGDLRLPDEYHLLTPQARQDAVVKRYVGEPSGLDVLLNKYTINTLWKKIPLLGAHSDFGWTTASGADGELGQVYSSSTYSDRIALDYTKIVAKRLYLEALGVSADIPPSPVQTEGRKVHFEVPADK